MGKAWERGYSCCLFGVFASWVISNRWIELLTKLLDWNDVLDC